MKRWIGRGAEWRKKTTKVNLMSFYTKQTSNQQSMRNTYKKGLRRIRWFVSYPVYLLLWICFVNNFFPDNCLFKLFKPFLILYKHVKEGFAILFHWVSLIKFYPKSLVCCVKTWVDIIISFLILIVLLFLIKIDRVLACVANYLTISMASNEIYKITWNIDLWSQVHRFCHQMWGEFKY